MALEVKLLSQITLPADLSSGYETAGPCPKCSFALPPLAESAPDYFKDGNVKCSECMEDADLWKVTLAFTLATPASAWSLTSLGATGTHILISTQTGSYAKIDIKDHGAPENARILWTVYTSQGGPDGAVSVIEAHGNSPVRQILGTEISLYCVPLGEGKVPRSGNVSIGVVWIRGEESAAWPYLVSAFQSVAIRDYAPAMVFAQSAVEIALMPLIANRFKERGIATDHVKSFMRDALNYSNALNVVLPYICTEIGIRPMPDDVRGALNKLRKTRNEIVHAGITSSEISPEVVTEAMTAAAFGFEFVRFVESLL